MTQEDKQLLIKDLCARLPYGVNLHIEFYDLQGEGKLVSRDVKLTAGNIGYCFDNSHWIDIKPYLRPMSSITEEEKKEYKSFFSIGEYSCGGSLYGEEYEYIADGPDDISQSICLFDWLDQHHFDYRGLIEKGLALEALKGMYYG